MRIVHHYAASNSITAGAECDRHCCGAACTYARALDAAIVDHQAGGSIGLFVGDSGRKSSSKNTSLVFPPVVLAVSTWPVRALYVAASL